METTTSKFDQEIFIINNDGKVESLTYAEYLNEYHSDETTSPRGVENRIQTAGVILNESGEVIQYSINDRDGLIADEKEGEEKKYALYTWGVGGNNGHLLRDEFYDTEMEANEAVLKSKELDYHNGNYNYPCVFYTKDEAEEESLDMAANAMGIDKEVVLSIEKKQKRVDEIREKRKIEESKKYYAEQEIVFAKYSNLIQKIEGESYKETEKRLSSAMPEKIHGNTFHKIVKHIRK